MRLTPSTPVAVLGAGAMGAGIAQVALRAGHPVLLADARPDAAARARDGIARALAREAERGRMAAGDAEAALARLTALPGADDLTPIGGCGLVIEAVVEDLAAKGALFARVEDAVGGDAVLATNTSSLSITAIAAACRRPERVLGVHFFNPAPVLPLVEVVPGLATDGAVLRSTRALVDAWG